MARTFENQRTGIALSASTLLVLLVLDRLVPPALSQMFALSPLVACSVLSHRRTAAFGAAAAVAAALAPLWNDVAQPGHDLVRVIDVSAVGASAVAIAWVRTRREERMRRLTRLSDIAQRAVLPVLPAHARSTEIAYRYQSAAEDAVIGGDLYDCYHSRQHTRFLIGDVRGKGLGAVEQAARVIRAFRQAAAIQSDLAAVAADMNDYLVPFFDYEEFVTAALLDTTDPERPQLVVAGHPPPLLVHADGSAELLTGETNLPLGLGFGYESVEFTWETGDRLLLYTDGLSEARDGAGKFLDVRDLAPLIAGRHVEEALDAVLAAATAHTRDGLGDDAALVLLERTMTDEKYEPARSEHDWSTSLPR